MRFLRFISHHPVFRECRDIPPHPQVYTAETMTTEIQSSKSTEIKLIYCVAFCLNAHFQCPMQTEFHSFLDTALSRDLRSNALKGFFSSGLRTALYGEGKKA